MDFKYKVLKYNIHEPTLNVEYTPLDQELAMRLGKVRYSPIAIEAMAPTERVVHMHKLIIKAAPVPAWEKEEELRANQEIIKETISQLSEQTVSETEYKDLLSSHKILQTMEIV